jgi:hypothetical protein
VCLPEVQKDSKTRTIQASGDILLVPTRKKAIVGLGFRFSVRVAIRVSVTIRVRS